MKKMVLVLAMLATVVGLAFASGHTRSQVQSFVREYEQAANDFSTGVNAFVKNTESQQAERKMNSAQAKMNDIQAKYSYYLDELTDSDMDKIMRANEKISTASAKLQTFIQQNGY